MFGRIAATKGALANRAFWAAWTGILMVSGALVLYEYITPIAEAGADRIVDVGDSVTLDGSASTGAVEYRWRFGDSDTENGQIVHHSFVKEGIYEVALEARSQHGKWTQDTVKIIVKNQIPVVTAGSDISAVEDETVGFVGSATDTTNDMGSLSFLWDFGDGAYALGKTASHSYKRAGVFDALLTVTDHNGAIGRGTRKVTVTNSVPVASAGVDKTVYEGEAAILDGSVSSDTAYDGLGLRYLWDNGINGRYTQSIRYDDGTYMQTLTVADDDNALSTDTASVIVQNLPRSLG